MRYVSDFIGAVKARQTEIAGSVVAGNCTTYEAYQRLVGINAGLEEALDILNNLLKEEDKDE
jgi:thioredoxin reductase